ncbi:MAG: hypothetical protein OJI70_05850 [Zavarzinia sp.]|nr:hypothetical protein [Zavarzinia sp.]
MNIEARLKSRLGALFGSGLTNVKFFKAPQAGLPSATELLEEIERIEEAISAGRVLKVSCFDAAVEQVRFDKEF